MLSRGGGVAFQVVSRAMPSGLLGPAAGCQCVPNAGRGEPLSAAPGVWRGLTNRKQAKLISV